MSENKIEQVAAMFGKKLGEEFKVKVNCTTKKVLLCRFSKRGLCYQEGGNGIMNGLLLTL